MGRAGDAFPACQTVPAFPSPTDGCSTYDVERDLGLRRTPVSGCAANLEQLRTTIRTSNGADVVLWVRASGTARGRGGRRGRALRHGRADDPSASRPPPTGGPAEHRRPPVASSIPAIRPGPLRGPGNRAGGGTPRSFVLAGAVRHAADGDERRGQRDGRRRRLRTASSRPSRPGRRSLGSRAQ